MRVLMTGADGYIGTRMGGVLIDAGHDVTGLDTGFHRSGWLYHSPEPRPSVTTGDTRDITPDDLHGYDAVVHLGELSNDPVGELNRDLTYQINHRATVRLATLAKAAGVQRFVHMSSCSVYGASGDRPSSELDTPAPLTAYAESKVLVERDVGSLADDDFSPTFLRNATAFGASPRQRFDLVVNDLAATGYLYKEIRMTSDGSPWRPFVHILDIAGAVAGVLTASRDAVHGQIFNVGSDEQNYQVRTIAETVADVIPGCSLTFGEPSPDRRNYRASFEKIRALLPNFSCQWDVRRGVEELVRTFEAISFGEVDYRSPRYSRVLQVKHLLSTGQIDDDLRWTYPAD
ncbi:NAD-dependent epimerase/dehydratase family protein [Ilumatobacter nonamiensis]|uniref:NAD-dependent epimerase/dehydratase family protein n=1 Tax=Ilumatobacter nonamiensis TaxID=467093 RepID=UPI0005900EF5|nr:SDR family oxidoreductase [Ilumatobacter nonamiensis]